MDSRSRQAPPRTDSQTRTSTSGEPLATSLYRPSAPPPPQTTRERLARVWTRHPLKAWLHHRRRIAFFRQLHAMHKAGIGLPVAFKELARHSDPETRRAVSALAARVESGQGLAEAMAADSFFEEGQVALLAAAEQSGHIEKVLARIIEQLDKAQKLRNHALLMALYPSYLLFAFVFFGPLLSLPGAVASGAGKASLPGTYLGGLLSNLVTAGFSFAALVAFPFVVTLANKEREWDEVKLRIPLLAGVFKNLYAAKFALSLSSALSAGLEVNRALTLGVRSTGSPSLKPNEQAALKEIEKGGTFADAVGAVGVLDGPDMGTLVIAEKTGTLDRALETIGDERFEAASRSMRALVYVVLGGVMLFLLAGIVLKISAVLFGPIWDYYHAFDQIK